MKLIPKDDWYRKICTRTNMSSSYVNPYYLVPVQFIMNSNTISASSDFYNNSTTVYSFCTIIMLLPRQDYNATIVPPHCQYITTEQDQA